MDYVVWPLPNVTRRLALESRAIQDQFQQIAGVLASNPFPNPQFPLVTEERTRRGRAIYTFAAPQFPFSIVYLIVEPEDDDSDGILAVFDLIDHRQT